MINSNYKMQNNVNFGKAYPVKVKTAEGIITDPEVASNLLKAIKIVAEGNTSYPNSQQLMKSIKLSRLGKNFIGVPCDNMCFLTTSKTAEKIKSAANNNFIGKIIEKYLSRTNEVIVHANKFGDYYIATDISKVPVK